MDPLIHSKNSTKMFGGHPDDYLGIHEFLDFSKSLLPDHRHRLFLHNTLGIALAIKQFGSFIVNLEGKKVSVRDIAENHIIEDLGKIPTIEECASKLDPLVDNDTSSMVINAKRSKKGKSKKEPLKEVFLITRKCWEYNDEYYDERGTESLMVIEDEKAANEKCKELNLEFIKKMEYDCGYSGYSYFRNGSTDIRDVEGTEYEIDEVVKMKPEDIYEKFPELLEYEVVRIKQE